MVKLAVAIRRSSSNNVGQPRVRFPADALKTAPASTSFCRFEPCGLERSLFAVELAFDRRRWSGVAAQRLSNREGMSRLGNALMWVNGIMDVH